MMVSSGLLSSTADNNFGHGSAEAVLLKPNAAWKLIQGGRGLRATRALELSGIHWI